MDDIEKIARYLIKRAGDVHDAGEAMRFTQAACNTLHVMKMLSELGRKVNSVPPGPQPADN